LKLVILHLGEQIARKVCLSCDYRAADTSRFKFLPKTLMFPRTMVATPPIKPIVANHGQTKPPLFMEEHSMASSAKAFSTITTVSPRATGTRSYSDPITRHTYLYVPGSFTQQEARQVARSRGGYPVVFNNLDEWRRVVRALDYRVIAPAHTGHYQLPSGREPGLGWVTHPAGGVSTAPLNQLFNSDGPDDGIRNKWGWNIVSNDDDSTEGEVF
jgi:hypothetical protein